MSQFIDPDDLRAKARALEHRFAADMVVEQHEGWRGPVEIVRSRSYRPLRTDDPNALNAVPEDETLPPVYRRDGEYQRSRDTSVERRNARFRDGLPPPPLPPRYSVEGGPPGLDEIPRVLRPASPPLMNQEEYDNAARIASGEAPPMTYTMSQPPLTHSQKKRLKRKLKKQERSGQNQQQRSAPFPLQIDQQITQTIPQVSAPIQHANGYAVEQPPEVVLPTNPEQVRQQCEAAITVMFSDGSMQRLYCPLTPYPHPNQPHLVKLAVQGPAGAEAFLGFWLAGE